MYDNSIEDIIKAKEGSESAMTKLVENNSGLIWSIVRRFKDRGYELEDLYQIGSIGLINSIAKLFVEDKLTLEQSKAQIEEKLTQLNSRWEEVSEKLAEY